MFFIKEDVPMEGCESRFTVYFEDPFWVGVFELISDESLEVCKVVFGAEPTESELHDYILKRWNTLCFSRSIPVDVPVEKHISPKRRQRLIHKEMGASGISTKAQQAIKLEMETKKTESASISRQQQMEKAAARFQQQRQKRKEKHKGH
jgi:hypothetical protein